MYTIIFSRLLCVHANPKLQYFLHSDGLIRCKGRLLTSPFELTNPIVVHVITQIKSKPQSIFSTLNEARKKLLATNNREVQKFENSISCVCFSLIIHKNSSLKLILYFPPLLWSPRKFKVTLGDSLSVLHYYDDFFLHLKTLLFLWPHFSF